MCERIEKKILISLLIRVLKKCYVWHRCLKRDFKKFIIGILMWSMNSREFIHVKIRIAFSAVFFSDSTDGKLSNAGDSSHF